MQHVEQQKNHSRAGSRVFRKLATQLVAMVLSFANLAGQAQPPPKPPIDPYGRSSPRGTVLGFLAACRGADYARARVFLNTKERGEAASELAEELCVVLNSRLPARLNELSDKPEGSTPFASRPDIELVGMVDTAKGNLDILLERVKNGSTGPVWLFASETLRSITDVYEETQVYSIENVFPEFLVKNRFLGAPLYEWLAVLAIALIYVGAGFLSKLLSPIAARIWHSWTGRVSPSNLDILPAPLRLILVALFIRVIAPKFDLPLLARQFWSSTAFFMSVCGIVWSLILLNGVGERSVRGRVGRGVQTGALSFLHFVRRTADLMVIFVGVLVVLYYFGVNPTAALAGLGVGGIAVALAAQKTLENVIGGMSVVGDTSVHLGDHLRVAGTEGIVEDIGLRSTRIRTLDRTVVSVPNGQLANLNVESLSLRDKFWFHHTLNLRLETSVAEMKSALQDTTALLMGDPMVESISARVNFTGVDRSSLQIEVFAYLLAHDYVHFLTLQEGLLLRVIETIEQAGTRLAYPSQMTYFPEETANKPLWHGLPAHLEREVRP